MLPVYIFNIVRQIFNVKEDTKTTKNLSEFSFFSNITEEIGENLQRSTVYLNILQKTYAQNLFVDHFNGKFVSPTNNGKKKV